MTKAIIITATPREYYAFLRKNNLNPHEYPFIWRSYRVKGYKDMFAFCVGTWWQVIDWDMEVYMHQHNIVQIKM